MAQYIIRNPFAVEKMQVGAPNRANPDGSVIYRSGLNPKIQRNFEVLDVSDLRAVPIRIRTARRSLGRSSCPIHPSLATFSRMKALLRAGLSGRVPAPPQRRFLITFIRRWVSSPSPASF